MAWCIAWLLPPANRRETFLGVVGGATFLCVYFITVTPPEQVGREDHHYPTTTIPTSSQHTTYHYSLINLPCSPHRTGLLSTTLGHREEQTTGQGQTELDSCLWCARQADIIINMGGLWGTGSIHLQTLQAGRTPDRLFQFISGWFVRYCTPFTFPLTLLPCDLLITYLPYLT